MALKSETSLVVGLATAAVVYGVYQIHMPDTASARASQSGNQHLDAARKTATWEAAAVVGGISLLAGDPTVFVIGGAVLVMIDFAHRIANHTDNVSGKVSGTANSTGVSADAEASVTG